MSKITIPLLPLVLLLGGHAIESTCEIVREYLDPSILSVVVLSLQIVAGTMTFTGTIWLIPSLVKGKISR